MANEILLNSISVQPGGIPITTALEERDKIMRGQIEGFQVILDKPDSLDPDIFSHLLKSAFPHLRSVKPTEIPFDGSTVDERDQYFARQFNYVIIPMAYAKVTTEGFPEAWIAPTLVHTDHPLASAKGNHLHIETSRSTPPLREWGNERALIPEGKTVIAHYMRFTAENGPYVLATLSDVIGRQDINICELRKPESEKDQPVEIAFLVDPCRVERVYTALAAIRELPTYVVNSAYRALGNPTLDLSRK